MTRSPQAARIPEGWSVTRAGRWIEPETGRSLSPGEAFEIITIQAAERARCSRAVTHCQLAYAALQAGSSTSAEIAAALRIPIANAAKRLAELETAGLIERVGASPRNGSGTRGGGGAIQWRVRSTSR